MEEITEIWLDGLTYEDLCEVCAMNVDTAEEVIVHGDPPDFKIFMEVIHTWFPDLMIDVKWEKREHLDEHMYRYIRWV